MATELCTSTTSTDDLTTEKKLQGPAGKRATTNVALKLLETPVMEILIHKISSFRPSEMETLTGE